jgi:hypothetical protein
MERTDQHDREPTPVIADCGASVPDLLAHAAHDYIAAQARRDQLTHEDRVHGNEPAPR